MRGRILVIDRSVPTPDQDSGSASTMSLLTILAKEGFAVTFAPLDNADNGAYSSALRDQGIRVASKPEWPSIDDVIDHFAPQQDVILLYRVAVANATFDHCRRVAPRAKICFHAVDLHFLREQRQAALSGNPAELVAAERTKDIELGIVDRADATIVVSQFEKELLSNLLPESSVHHIPILRAPPRGDYLRRLLLPYFGRSRRRDIVFLGGYQHSPNVDGVLWFMETIWPRLLQAGFRDKFVIAGSHVPPQLAALASSQVEVRGYVSDLAGLFRNARISVAPLRYGGGVKGKVVTSMSYGVPVVGTSIAVEGMGLQHGESALVANEPAQFAEQILHVYRDAPLWLHLSQGGLRAFDERFSLAAGAPKIADLFDGLVSDSKSTVTPVPLSQPI